MFQQHFLLPVCLARSALYFPERVVSLADEMEERLLLFLLSPMIPRASFQESRSSKAWTWKEWIGNKGSRETRRKIPGNIQQSFSSHSFIKTETWIVAISITNPHS